MKEKKLEKLFNLFLIIGPFLDALTAFMCVFLKTNFTIGVVIRFLYLVFLILYLIFMKEEAKEKRKTWLGLLIFGIYFLIFIILAWRNEPSVFIIQVKELLRSFYLPLLLFSFYRIYKIKKINPNIQFFVPVYFIYLGFILIPNLLNIGFDSYAVTKEGSIGFFYSANEISAILSILMPFYFYFLYRKQNFILTVLGTFILVFILLSLGTKGPFLSLALLVIIFGIRLLINFIQNKKWKLICTSLIIFSISLLALIIILPKTSFYKNIQVHLDYLEVNSIFQIFTDFHKVDHFIFSSRLSFLNNSNKLYTKAPLSNKLFGLGYYQGKEEVKMIEMDPMDIFYRHGIIGFLLYFGMIIYLLVPILKELYKKENKDKYWIEKSSLFLIILLSFFTGHILLAPAVSIFVAYLFIYLYSKKEEIK